MQVIPLLMYFCFVSFSALITKRSIVTTLPFSLITGPGRKRNIQNFGLFTRILVLRLIVSKHRKTEIEIINPPRDKIYTFPWYHQIVIFICRHALSI